MTFIDVVQQPLNRQQRRMRDAAVRSPQKHAAIIRANKMEKTETLSEAAHARLVRNLEGFGNVLSQAHSVALMRMVGGFSMLATRKVTGRYAFALNTGCGKTQAVVAWCAEVHKLRLSHSVAVAASKVEALCELKRSLIANGVPADKIGLWHRYKYDPDMADKARRGDAPKHASEPATTDHDTKQFLLVTHNRIRGGRSTELLNTYKGRDRDLVLWDESLLVSDHRAVGRAELLGDLGWLRPQIELLDNGNVKKASSLSTLDYLDRCMKCLEEELTAQVDEDRAAKRITLPPADLDILDIYRSILDSFPEDRVASLQTLLDISSRPVRAIRSGQGGGAYVAYDISVPHELKRIAVLDASWPIRELEQLDPTIKTMPDFDGRVKTYDVTIHHLRKGSGRYSTEMSFRQEKVEDRKLSREIVEVVGGIPENEGVILFTFKQRGKLNITDILRRDLEAAGVDLNATVLDHQGHSRPRFVFLRWGQETSLSEHSYSSNVIFAGVLHRSDADLLGAIVAQQDDLLIPVTQEQLSKVKASEVAHNLYQGMSRGSCRIVVNGRSRRMKVWLTISDPKVRELLDLAMPGVTWAKWDTKHLRPDETKIEDTARKIAEYLDGLSAEITKVSTRAIKRAVEGLSDVPMRSFTEAVRQVCEFTPWGLDGRSLTRLSN
jgi:hypothetical protein